MLYLVLRFTKILMSARKSTKIGVKWDRNEASINFAILIASQFWKLIPVKTILKRKMTSSTRHLRKCNVTWIKKMRMVIRSSNKAYLKMIKQTYLKWTNIFQGKYWTQMLINRTKRTLYQISVCRIMGKRKSKCSKNTQSFRSQYRISRFNHYLMKSVLRSLNGREKMTKSKSQNPKSWKSAILTS